MRDVQSWFDEYAASHGHPTNKALHWICVPVIVFTVLGLLWSLPVPASWPLISPLLNWGTLAMLAAIMYYGMLSLKLALGMAVVLWLMALALLWLDRLPWPLWAICLGLFVLAWVGQFIGHAIEGKRPSFARDLQFLLIGPFWLLADVYRRLGIAY